MTGNKPRSLGSRLRRWLEDKRKVLDCEELVGRGMGWTRILPHSKGNRRVCCWINGCRSCAHSSLVARLSIFSCGLMQFFWTRSFALFYLKIFNLCGNKCLLSNYLKIPAHLDHPREPSMVHAAINMSSAHDKGALV